MGESLSSVAQLISKFGRIINATASSQNFFFSVFSRNPNQVTLPTIQHLSRMYVLQRGSAIYNSDLAMNSIAPLSTLTTQIGPSFGRTQTLSSSQFDYGMFFSTLSTPNAMIEIPYYSTQLFQLVDGIQNLSYANNLTLPGALYYSRNMNIYNGYVAPGKDFMFAYLIPPPRVS